MPPEPVVIVVDTREQEPYSFDPVHVVSVRRALPCGDYSLAGREREVAIERKSLADFVSTVIGARERFARELRVLSTYALGCVVVEASLEDILEHRYRSAAHPNAVFGAVLSIIVDHDVPVYFCGDRQTACHFVEGLLRRFARRHRRGDSDNDEDGCGGNDAQPDLADHAEAPQPTLPGSPS